MTEKTRHPLYFYNPYTFKQYEAFRKAYAYAVRRIYAEPEALEFFDARWSEIQEAANLCDRQLSIWRHLNDKTKRDHRKGRKPSQSDTDRAKIRGLRPMPRSTRSKRHSIASWRHRRRPRAACCSRSHPSLMKSRSAAWMTICWWLSSATLSG